jgi:hypothetical protein
LIAEDVELLNKLGEKFRRNFSVSQGEEEKVK